MITNDYETALYYLAEIWVGAPTPGLSSLHKRCRVDFVDALRTVATCVTGMRYDVTVRYVKRMDKHGKLGGAWVWRKS